MCLGNFLLELLTDLPVLLRMLVRHLIELSLDFGCLGSEFFNELKLYNGFIVLTELVGLMLVIHLLLRIFYLI